MVEEGQWKTFSWTTFPTHLIKTFKDLVTEGHFADVTLVGDDQIPMKAHKIVLSASSPVLKHHLINDTQDHPVIYLRTKQPELLSILQFMYFGEVIVFQDRIEEVLSIARELQIKELVMEDGNYKDSIDISEEDNVGYSEATANGLVAENIDIYNRDDVEFDGTEFIKTENEKIVKEETDDENLDLTFLDDQEGFIALNLPEYIDENDTKMADLKNYNCQVCRSSFKTKVGVQYHYRSKHEGIKYSCDQCEYKGTDKSSVRRHTKQKHEGLKYSCNECIKQFTDLGRLKDHQKAKHLGVTYFCHKCPYTASLYTSYRAHQETKHEGVVHSCNHCSYQTKNRSSLTHHKKKQAH